ncbi:nucleotide exchange factor GrpE [Desulfoscipio geothermicus]|uniref:Protein GrpE n=1 Tax=Desulfoscipio geothermicus DSM 3669 TaxID=1121426 RepID=A0A1I6D2R3_9FIRM|nr:nucleotide exchange factor GrpE [Desulfoscipio geothermicus]SFQ99745.1 molecular chaperone GrpE [Desulfoscipio geothermicus DSM 3669]
MSKHEENANQQQPVVEEAAGQTENAEVEENNRAQPQEHNPPVGSAGDASVDKDTSGGPDNPGEDESVSGALGHTDVEQLQKELAEYKTKTEEYFNRLVRLQADFDNYRKRVQKEKEDFFKYASASLCEALLPVLDNFQLALAAREEDPAKVVEGVEMIYRQLQDVLQKEGLTPVAAVGEQFDPVKHEAVMQEATEEHPENTVIEELRRGYYLKDRVIRPAMVKVAKAKD